MSPLSQFGVPVGKSQVVTVSALCIGDTPNFISVFLGF